MAGDSIPKFRTDDRVGRWTILGERMQSDSGEAKWLCRCDCGTERYVLERSLLYGGSTSCGCLRKERAKQANAYDLTGMQFGDLTVIRRLEGTLKGAAKWLCKCSCGGECTATASQLMTGRRTRCSSKAHQKNYAYTDISGRRFGRLVALYPTGRSTKGGNVIWHCKCDCGNETDVSYNSLVHANQQSCGCRRKEHESKLHSYLTHVAGTSVEMLSSKKLPSNNSTGHKGVYLIRGKYVAKIVFQKKQYTLGSYERLEDAALARKQAEAILFDSVSEHYRLWKRYADADPNWAENNPIEVTVSQNNGALDVVLRPTLTGLPDESA